MKLYYFLGLLLLGVLVKASEEDSSKDSDSDSAELTSADRFYKNVEEIIEKKCKEAGGDDAFDNLKKVVEEVRSCVTSHLPKTTEELKELQDSSEESDSNLCKLKRQKVRGCFDGIIEALENCAQADEKFLPHFIFDAIDGVLNYVCADEDAVIRKFINSLECIHTFEDKNVTDTCNDHLKILKDDTPEDIKITKEELCHDLKFSKTCYAELIEEHCPGSQLKDLIVEAYGAINTACEKKH